MLYHNRQFFLSSALVHGVGNPVYFLFSADVDAVFFAYTSYRHFGNFLTEVLLKLTHAFARQFRGDVVICESCVFGALEVRTKLRMPPHR